MDRLLTGQNLKMEKRKGLSEKRRGWARLKGNGLFLGEGGEKRLAFRGDILEYIYLIMTDPDIEIILKCLEEQSAINNVGIVAISFYSGLLAVFSGILLFKMITIKEMRKLINVVFYSLLLSILGNYPF